MRGRAEPRGRASLAAKCALSLYLSRSSRNLNFDPIHPRDPPHSEPKAGEGAEGGAAPGAPEAAAAPAGATAPIPVPV